MGPIYTPVLVILGSLVTAGLFAKTRKLLPERLHGRAEEASTCVHLDCCMGRAVNAVSCMGGWMRFP